MDDQRSHKELQLEIKRLEKQLIEAQKMESIGTLAGGIGHEFNNILFIIQGYTDLALVDLEKNRDPTGKLQKIKESCLRASDLIDQILSFARHSEKQRKLVDISPFIHEASKLLRSALPSTITIDVTISSNKDSYIMADPAEIHQVIMNLCTNASQSIDGSHGTIAITLEDYMADDLHPSTHSGIDQGHYLMLRISDSGKGISRSVVPRIFEPFFTTKKVGEGTGLGLSVVHGIVTDMGGSIFVDSVNGKGTTFTIYFPVADKLFVNKSREAQKVVPKGLGENVLLVDDDVVLLNMMARMLEELNYRCTQCSNGVEALKLFKKDPHHFDLLLTGQTMPGITGDSLCLAVRSVRSDIPIVLCTGYSEQLTPDRISELGIDAFLSKPILLDRLGQTLNDLLSR